MVSPPSLDRESIGTHGIPVCIKDGQFNVGVLMVSIEDAEGLVASKLGRRPVTAGGNVLLRRLPIAFGRYRLPSDFILLQMGSDLAAHH